MSYFVFPTQSPARYIFTATADTNDARPQRNISSSSFIGHPFYEIVKIFHQSYHYQYSWQVDKTFS
jgi:hypothetical protein